MTKVARRRHRTVLAWLIGAAAGLVGLAIIGILVWPRLPVSVTSGHGVLAKVARDLPTHPNAWRGRIDYPRLDARLRELMTDPSMEGLAVAVVEDGRLAFVQGYGLTSAQDGRPVDAETMFRWASLSKTVSGTLSAKLAQAGVFSLSDQLGAFDTSLRLAGGAERTLTLEDLLSQRTGLPRHAFDDRLEAGDDPADIRRLLATVRPVCPPQTCHTYQNVAYDTISEVIAGATGEPYASAVETGLFRPLGMRTATIGLAGLTDAPNWARPHRNGQLLPLSEAYYRLPAAAGVNSTIIDLAIWMQAQMGLRPDVLPPAVLASAQRPRVATASPYGRIALARELKDAGYGLGFRSFTYKGHRLVSHSGGVSGYRATMMFDPATRTGVVMLWNSDSGLPFRVQGEFLDLAYQLPFTDWVGLQSPAPTPAESLP